MHVTENFANFV